jgi:eukaryotic-like serine/threonine-protein kinase
MMMNLIGQEIGNYRLLHLLGQGSSAHVYLGEHRYQRSFVALKILVTQATNQWKKREGNEVSMLSHITHPHIVCIREHGIQARLYPLTGQKRKGRVLFSQTII